MPVFIRVLPSHYEVTLCVACFEILVVYMEIFIVLVPILFLIDERKQKFKIVLSNVPLYRPK